MKILLADDHTLFRDALIEYMRRVDENIEILVADDFYQAYDVLCKDNQIDLTLLDFKMPGMDGLKGLEKIRKDFPDLPVTLLSGVAEEHHIRKALEMGARGFFPKTLSGKSLMKAIELILAGEKFLPINASTNQLQPSYYNGNSISSNGRGLSDQDQACLENDPGLTKREKEVLAFLVKGAPNKEIARELDLQIVTIKLHVRGICKKLNAKNRTQAALTAQKLDLV